MNTSAANIKLLSSIIKNDRESAAKYLKADDFNPDTFYGFTDTNLLSGALFTAVSGPKLLDIFPRIMIDRFKSAYLDQWKSNERLIKEMDRISALCTTAGIEVIFLKGPLLAWRFYGDTGSRNIGDIDILVRAGSVMDVEKLLIKSGFALKSRVILNRGISAYFAHHFEYQKNNIYLEVHWFLQKHFSYKIDYAKIWESRKTVINNGKTYRVLSDEYELTLQLLSLFSDIQSGTAKLRTFLDIFKILESITDNTDWKVFFANRKNERILSISVNMLDLALNLMECTEYFPKLSAQIAESRRLIKHINKEQMGRLFQPSRLAVRNKLWAWGIYECSPLGSFCWWAISLPFRLAVYNKLSLHKFLGR